MSRDKKNEGLELADISMPTNGEIYYGPLDSLTRIDQLDEPNTN